MTVLPGLGYFPDRPADPPQGDECPRCGTLLDVDRFGEAECDECGWANTETDRLLDAERDAA